MKMALAVTMLIGAQSLQKKDLPQGSDGQKIGALYRLYMDSVSRNRMGYESIMPYLKQVREVQTRDEALRLMYALDAKGFNTAPFGLSLSLNPFNSSEYLMFAGHGGTSLPKEYYDQPNEQQKATVAAVKSLNKDYLKMVGYSDAAAEQKTMVSTNRLQGRLGHRIQDRYEDTRPGGPSRPDGHEPPDVMGAAAQRLQGHRLCGLL